MATNPIHAFNLPSPYQTELDELTRRQKMAELLQAQAFQPAEKFSYKGIEARVSPLSYLAKALQGYTSAKDQREILAERKALGERFRTDSASDMSAIMESLKGTPTIPERASLVDPQELQQQADYGTPPLPNIPAVPSRAPGTIDPSILPFIKTQQGQEMAMKQYMAQIAPKAPLKGGYGDQFLDPNTFKPLATIPDKPAPPPSPPAPTGNLAELAAENANRTQKGLPPLSIAEYREQIAKAGRTPAVPRERSVYDANRGGVVNLDTGVFTPAMQGGKPIGPAQSLTVAKEVMGIQQGRSTMQGAINAVEASPSAFGLKRGAATASGSGVAESIAGRFDTPQETEARAYVFNNVSAVIKERAGTAQSAQELTRINSFLPGATDNANQIINKLKGYLKYLDDLEAGTVGKPTQPTTPTVQTPIYANAPGKPKLMSTDGGKTWKEAK